MKDLLSEIKELENDMILDRRALHRHPEVSGSEYWTTGYIKDKLNGFNVPIEKLELDVGVSALIKGSRPGKTICIRHDIDALRIQENTDLSFSSEIEGISHACGHDIHTVIALYCAKLLNERRKEIAGNVRIVFQPAEETAEGAKMMINAGIMDLEPQNDIVIGVHTHPATMAGKISVRKGPMEAGVDFLKITVEGKGGHGAYPHRCVDPILTAAYLISELQTVITRENDAVKPAILTFGSIHGGNAGNVIPDYVELMGTLRNFYPECREKNLNAVKRITKCVCESMNARGTVEIMGGLPPLYNDENVVDGIIQAADEMLGPGHVDELEFPSPGSDDFSVFLNYSKGAQFFIGTADNEENSRLGLHNAQNIFDEKSITVGVAVLCRYILNSLKNID